MILESDLLCASRFVELRSFQVLRVRALEVKATARVGIAVAIAALVALRIDKLVLGHADRRT